MTIAELLEDLTARGVEVWRGADGRCFVEPLAKLTEGELATLREHRTELLELLAGDVVDELASPSKTIGSNVPSLEDAAGEKTKGRHRPFDLPEVLVYGEPITRAHIVEQLELDGREEKARRFERGELTDVELTEVLESTKCWLTQRIQLHAASDRPVWHCPPRPEQPTPAKSSTKHHHHHGAAGKLRQATRETNR